MTRAERGLLAPEEIELALGAVLFAPGERIEHVVFPDGGLVSLVVELPDGARAEVGAAGREGLVGLPALLGEPVSAVRAVVQVPGRARRVGAGALRTAADGSRNLRELVRRWSMASLAHAELAAVCNATHPLERRAARWLLGVQDRVGPGFPITQEYLAVMLGARRPTVSAVMQSLKAAGLIRTARGQVAVADRAGLEAAACPCYRAERERLERLLPPRGLGGGV
jgi:CRP-like cAMP-binding protein